MNTTLLEDLYYPSESDEPIEWFDITGLYSDTLTPENVQKILNVSGDVSEISVEDFWRPLTTIEDWFDDFQIAQCQKASELRCHVETILKNCRAVRCAGRVEVTLALIGQTEANTWAGLKTILIES